MSQNFIRRHPFTSLLLIAIAVRILVVIFVPGFGSNSELQHPTLFLGFLELIKGKIGVSETPAMMLLSRSLYAFVSLFTVAIIYRICDLSTNKQTAWLLALIPTFSIVMPSFGIVENASAFLALPLVLYGSNVVLRQEVLRKANLTENVHRSSFFIAGLVLGFGICIWIESFFIVVSILVILCLQRNFKGALITLAGALSSIAFAGLLLLAFHVNPLKYFTL